MHTAIIGIGSNINALQNIDKAIALLSETTKVVEVSEILTTQPIGIADQPDFSNGAALVTTKLDSVKLKSQLKEIEDRLGRDRSRPKFGPREIDLDIIVFDNIIVDNDYHSRHFLKKLVDSVWHENK